MECIFFNVMKKEDIKILLFDLCSRLPNNVILKTPDGDGYLCDICNAPLLGWLVSVRMGLEKKTYGIEEVLPYLRTFDSIEDYECDKFEEMVFPMETWDGEMPAVIRVKDVTKLIEYYNSIMLDYNDLIEKGLAVEAPDGMYRKSNNNK